MEVPPELKLRASNLMAQLRDFMELVPQSLSIYRDRAAKRKWRLLANNYHASEVLLVQVQELNLVYVIALNRKSLGTIVLQVELFSVKNPPVDGASPNQPTSRLGNHKVNKRK